MAFIDWELPNAKGSGKMKGNEISLIYKEKGTRSMTFNQEVSKQVIEKGYKFINIKQDDITGELGLEINNVRGVKLGITGDRISNSFNVKMSKEQWVGRVADTLGLTKDGTRHVLKISDNLSKLDRCMFFRIIK